jgi:hypothetical protein
MSLAAKGKKVPCVTSSSCPCVTSSSCPCVTSSSCPWQQKENSKQGKAGVRAGQGRGGPASNQTKIQNFLKNIFIIDHIKKYII